MNSEILLITILDKLNSEEKEKFKRLKSLDTFSFQDVDLLSDDEDVAALLVETENTDEKTYKNDMVMAKLFVKKYIRGNEYYKSKEDAKEFVGAVRNFFTHGHTPCTYYAWDNVKKEIEKRQKEEEENFAKLPKETVLDYKGKLICQLLKPFSLNKMTPADLFSEVVSNISENKDFYEFIETIDFSKNQLGDPDSIMIKETILLLSKNIKNNLTINLTGNHFYGYEEKYRNMIDPCLFEILRSEKVSTLILCENPIYTKEHRHDFFTKVFDEGLLHKLIFTSGIPSETELRKMCDELDFYPEDCFVKISMETHENFFNNIIKNRKSIFDN